MQPSINTIVSSMSDFQKKVAGLLKKHPNGINQAKIAEHLDVSESKVSRTVSDMIKQGSVLKTGAARTSTLKLSPQIVYWTTPAHLRPSVHFDQTVVQNYVVNQSQYLTKECQDRLLAITPQEPLDASTYSHGVLERFLIDLSFASSALEGNTYNQLETEALIKYGQEAEGKPLHDATMILNHKRAISFVLDNMNAPLDNIFVCKLHALLMRGLLGPEQLGVFRKTEVSISGSSYKPATSSLLLQSSISQIMYKAEEIINPFEAMIFVLANVSYVQAFDDGNKRVGRVLANIPLLRKGLPPLSFVGVDKNDYIQGLLEFYEQNSTETLSRSITEGYLQAAHVYNMHKEASTQPKMAELRLRKTIDDIMPSIILSKITPDKIFDFVDKKVKNIAEKDRQDLVEILINHINALSSVSSVLWGVSEDDVKSYQETIQTSNAKKQGLKI